jgi:hypothetical protein
VSAKVQGWVWDLDLSAQPKLLLLWLANRATNAGVCFPTKRMRVITCLVLGGLLVGLLGPAVARA